MAARGTNRTGKQKNTENTDAAKKTMRLADYMKKKLLLVFVVVIGLLVALAVRIVYIQQVSGETYEKIVLSQQEYSSTTIPFRRGDITDSNGTVLAVSTDVYNVVLDCSVLTSNENYMEPTIAALKECIPEEDLKYITVDGESVQMTYEYILEYIEENPDSQYLEIAEQLPYEEIEDFVAMQEENSLIRGIWFETEYIREYPYGSLASALIGYSSDGNAGLGGIEGWYDDTLNGTDGRQYGYLNSESEYEITVKEAVDGLTIVSTIDANLQSIVEEKILEFYETLTDNYEEGGGAEHIAVIIMDPDTGEVLAMANYPNYDYTLTQRENLELFYTEEEIEAMSDEDWYTAVESLKQNFCITYTYEPGSTAKPFTVAAGLETGTLTEDMTFYCDGYEQIAGHTIRCVNRSGHGLETLADALSDSCNDALMQMSYKIGASNFAKYQQIFNFGLKTNIDLPGESRTDTLIYTEDTLTTINLATNSFGQNFNVTMIQLISAYCSLVNGGSYYLPHVVGSYQDSDGNTVETIEPTLLRQTVSEETSETLISYLTEVVENGTGSTAKVDGYSMAGKTGTAQKYELDEDGNATSTRAEGKYLVSFIGNVPADDPELVIYCVVDEPNVEDQAHSSYAQNLVREILEEALPYLNIYPDEELDGTNSDLDIVGNTITQSSEEDSSEDSTEDETEESSEESSEAGSEETSEDSAEDGNEDTVGE